MVNDVGPLTSDEKMTTSQLCGRISSKVLEYKYDAFGIVITKTGIEAFIGCNKFPGIRCAKIHSKNTAQMSKEAQYPFTFPNGFSTIMPIFLPLEARNSALKK